MVRLGNFILVNIYPDLKEYEYLVCSDKEVILSNCHSNEMIENFKNFIDTKENSKIIQKNQLKGKKDESENNDKGRVSFRQKAEDFGKSKKITKEKKERQSNVKVNIEDNKMNIYSKNKKNEKRQGWWSQ